eukprot:CAMPEP_0174277184 /NCGR_PEP_ID=MMETSP0439-20130205/60794_1 /TAXON_ID=0 /ORGANISM="Stereomyxa ramosa, Strain Chinc5" /LENGTH=40 /DNA_ID= /DNA_START= /DNA_END= /DNA_ORIENTATION=
MESEYYAVTEAVKEAMWLRSICKEIGKEKTQQEDRRYPSK